MRGVDDLEVELDPVEAARRVLEGADPGRARAGDDARARRRSHDAVSVAHPDGLLGREIAEEGALAGRELGLPELADTGLLDASAELERQELHAVADPERRDPELEDRGVTARRAVGVDRGRPAREDQRRGVPPRDLLGAGAVGDELGVDPCLANAAGDQLRVLAAEVEHEHWPLLCPRLGVQGDDAQARR